MPKTTTTADDAKGRTPVREGILYCSPRCGCGCTWAEYQWAKENAKMLARALGPDWTPRVWENGRWHYAAGKGVCAVHPSITWSMEGEFNNRPGTPELRGYTAYFNSVQQHIGRDDHDPVAALQKALQSARDAMAKLGHDIVVIEAQEAA